MASRNWQGFPSVSGVKNLPAMQETQNHSLGGEDPLENGMATQISVPAVEKSFLQDKICESAGLIGIGWSVGDDQSPRD